MTLTDVLRYALGALRGYRLRTLLLLLAMAIGVAAVVVLTSLGEGARRYVASEFAALGTHLLYIFPGRSETTGGLPPLLGETPRDLTLDDALALLRSPAITAVAPIVIGAAPISWRGREREGVILGTTPAFLALRHIRLSRGRFAADPDPRRATPVCVIGDKIREELFGRQPALGQWVRIGDYGFRVSGILAPQGLSLGIELDEMALIPVASAQRIFNTASLFRLMVQAPSRAFIARARQDTLAIIRARHEGEEDITVVTQDAVLSAFDRILRALTLTVAGIAAISLLVAGILIMNVMLVAVSQRTAEIGLLKALGSPSRGILTLFITEAVLLSVGGGLLGIAVGAAGSWTIGRLYPILPVTPPAWAVAAGLVTALASGILFGALPARRAARLDPIEALARRR